MANKLDQVEFSHVNTIKKEAGFSGFTDVQTAWPYISWRLSVIINKSRNSSSKDRPIQFYSQFLKKAFLFAETNYFCTIVSEDLVNSDESPGFPLPALVRNALLSTPLLDLVRNPSWKFSLLCHLQSTCFSVLQNNIMHSAQMNVFKVSCFLLLANKSCTSSFVSFVVIAGVQAEKNNYDWRLS